MGNQCTNCQSIRVVKNGRSRHGHQRFRCRDCGATFGQTDHRRVEPERRENALKHYAEGVGLRATERLVGVSHNSVMNWVRQEVAGQALERVDAAQIETIEADELWTYVGEKKPLFGSGGLLIALPSAYSAGRWVIVTPARPERWARRFLAALNSLTPPTTGRATAKSSRKPSTSKAKRTPTPSRA
jgi:transposase-like protein